MACDTQVVKINRDGTPDPDPCELSKRAKQRIIWVSESDNPYDIRFEQQTGSPFTQREFKVEARGWAESGPIDANAKEAKYTYHTYQAGTMQVAADPDVIING